MNDFISADNNTTTEKYITKWVMSIKIIEFEKLGTDTNPSIFNLPGLDAIMITLENRKRMSIKIIDKIYTYIHNVFIQI